MNATLALKMLTDKKARTLFTVLGIATLFFLAAAQFGLLVGWCNTNSAIIRHADVDIWVNDSTQHKGLRP
jgi:putative ABC transport system permease protein